MACPLLLPRSMDLPSVMSPLRETDPFPASVFLPDAVLLSNPSILLAIYVCFSRSFSCLLACFHLVAHLVGRGVSPSPADPAPPGSFLPVPHSSLEDRCQEAIREPTCTHSSSSLLVCSLCVSCC